MAKKFDKYENRDRKRDRDGVKAQRRRDRKDKRARRAFENGGKR